MRLQSLFEEINSDILMKYLTHQDVLKDAKNQGIPIDDPKIRDKLIHIVSKNITTDKNFPELLRNGVPTMRIHDLIARIGKWYNDRNAKEYVSKILSMLNAEHIRGSIILPTKEDEEELKRKGYKWFRWNNQFGKKLLSPREQEIMKGKYKTPEEFMALEIKD